MTLLSVSNLTTAFATSRGEITAVEDVSFSLDEGEILGIVGESGTGKSVTALTIMGLLPQPPRASPPARCASPARCSPHSRIRACSAFAGPASPWCSRSR